LDNLQCPPLVSRHSPGSQNFRCADIQIKSEWLRSSSVDGCLDTAKVTYDLQQVNQQDLPALRDTLLAALERYHSGPRSIVVQLCLALAGIALQMPTWLDAVQTMTDSFGRNPATVPTLLQFLTLLPEELNSNTKIPVTVSFYDWPHLSRDAYNSL